MYFDIITIFPDIFDPYFNTSIIKRAQEKKLVAIKIHDLRKWTTDKHKTVDDRPYGGGPGMILKVEPIWRTLKALKSKVTIRSRPSGSSSGSREAHLGVEHSVSRHGREESQKSKVILLTPKGKRFDQKIAERYAGLDRIILVCGRYEGIDERVTKFTDEQISVGSYVLTGGELPAMIVVDAVTRLIPGVIKPESLQEESFSLSNVNLEYPQYTRPEVFTYKDTSGRIKSLKAPNVLLSGNHEKIKQWRKRHAP